MNLFLLPYRLTLEMLPDKNLSLLPAIRLTLEMLPGMKAFMLSRSELLPQLQMLTFTLPI